LTHFTDNLGTLAKPPATHFPFVMIPRRFRPNDKNRTHHTQKMKSVKLLAAGLLALATAASSFAVTNLHITGSTAFRKAMYTSLVTKLGGTANCKVVFVGAANGLLGSNQATFRNAATGETVYCCMAGSVGGVNWVANQIPAATGVGAPTGSAWLSITANGTATAPSADLTTGGTPVAAGSAVFDGAQVADVTMSDSLQSSTPFNYTGVKKLITKPAGIVTFTFAKGLQDTSGITAAQYAAVDNMTPLAFQNLASLGSAPLSMFSGVEADDTVEVVLTGRDDDSGTRLAAFAETGLGTVQAGNVQYQAFNSSNADVGGLAAPGAIDHLTPFATSSLGYSSGGKIKNVLKSTQVGALDGNGVPFVLVSYLGLGDTPGATQQLNYNGVPYSAAAVTSGQYTFWTKEFLMYRSDKINAVDANNLTFATALATVISTNAPISGGIHVGDMQVDRSFEGGVIGHN
jgi:hypothetical protein